MGESGAATGVLQRVMPQPPASGPGSAGLRLSSRPGGWQVKGVNIGVNNLHGRRKGESGCTPGGMGVIGRQARVEEWMPWGLEAKPVREAHPGSCKERGIESLAASVPDVASPGCLGK